MADALGWASKPTIPRESFEQRNHIYYYCGGATGFGGGVITAIDAKNGAVLGELGSFSDLNGVSVIADGTLYTGSHGNLHRNKWYGTLYAVNISTGAEVWSFGNSPEFGSIYNAPAVSNSVVYFGSEDGNLYALNATDGTMRWNFTTAGPVHSSPAVSNGVVYFGSEDGNLYAVG